MIKNTGLDRLYLQIKDRLNEAYHEINLSGEPIDGKYCKSVENKLKQIMKWILWLDFGNYFKSMLTK